MLTVGAEFSTSLRNHIPFPDPISTAAGRFAVINCADFPPATLSSLIAPQPVAGFTLPP